MARIEASKQVGPPSGDELDKAANVRKEFESKAGMHRVIQHFKAFRLFAQYLSEQGCAQSLLFVLELVQIKHAYQMKMNYNVCMSKKRVWSSSTTPAETEELDECKDDNFCQNVNFGVIPDSLSSKHIWTYLFE